jgi:hypothetical protein
LINLLSFAIIHFKRLRKANEMFREFGFRGPKSNVNPWQRPTRSLVTGGKLPEDCEFDPEIDGLQVTCSKEAAEYQEYLYAQALAIGGTACKEAFATIEAIQADIAEEAQNRS